MKGIVFTEFLEMVEDQFSPEVADQIIGAAELQSGGAYTSVGTYDHNEIFRLVNCLSEVTLIDAAQLVHSFGHFLLGRFAVLYPNFFQQTEGTFSFLDTIENRVHVDVKKLYPEAELPSFKTEFLGDQKMVLIYRSARPFAALAGGLIDSSIEYFGEDIRVEYQDLSNGVGDFSRFILTKQS